eukprot:TRINITY_DN21569_c0_g1_i2.p1 TRINITY_DN21569_c0_g1~~TRINITY_DN21569_c0_g1_i2.p1  ORF type:complete len:568 (+),score=135.24 TRINITY_DN21569_c0_g1_i2:40-1743(+)
MTMQVTKGQIYAAWARYNDSAGRSYYHNSITRETQWIPAVPPMDMDQVVFVPAMPASVPAPAASPWRQIQNEGKLYWYNEQTGTTQWEAPGSELPPLPVPADAAPPVAQEVRTEGSADPPTKKRRFDVMADGATDATVATATPIEESTDDYSERAVQFKEMLAELNLPQYATLQSIIPKILYDTRYKSLSTMDDRKRAFSDFMQEQHTKKQEAKKQEAKKGLQSSAKVSGGFDTLLQCVTKPMKYEKFLETYRSDPRLKAIGPRWRKDMFEAHVEKIRKEGTRSQEQKTSFMKLLKSIKGLSRRWEEAKEQIRNGENIEISWAMPEQWFEEYWSATAQKEDREKEALRALEVVHRREAAKVGRHVDRVREMCKEGSDAKDMFRALVSHHIKFSIPYKEARAIMKQDSQYEAIADAVPSKVRIDIYEAYIKSLESERCALLVKLMFDLYPVKITYKSDWEDVKRILKDDPRFQQVSDQRRLDCFLDFSSEARQRAEDALRRTLEDMERQIPYINKSIEDMHTLMRVQHAYADLSFDEELRDNILRGYAGRVPPSTAQRPVAQEPVEGG